MPRNDREGGDTDNLRSNTGRKLNYDPHDLFSQIEIANIQRVYKRQGEHALVVECNRSAAASVTASASASASLLDADTLSCTRRGTDADSRPGSAPADLVDRRPCVHASRQELASVD